MGNACTGSRAHVDCSRHAPSGLKLSKSAGLLAVDPLRQRIGTINVFLNDRNPVVREVTSQLELHPRVVYRNHAGQNQRTLVALLPKTVNDRSHEPENASGALKFHQGAPGTVELVKDFRVYRIRRLDALLVFGIPALRREFCAL